MDLGIKVIKSKMTEYGRVVFLCKHPGKANKETFHLIVEGEDYAFYNTIRKEMAEKAYDDLIETEK